MKPSNKLNQLSSLFPEKEEFKMHDQVDMLPNVKSQTLPVENQGKIRKNYKIGHVIAKSALGQIRKCQHIRTGQIRAVKFIAKDGIDSLKAKAKFVDELELLSQLDHPNIVKCYECFQDSKRYYIIIEYCANKILPWRKAVR